MSVWTIAIVAATSSVVQPTIAPTSSAVGAMLEQRMHARDQVDAGGHHRRGVDQRGDRRRALHRVREPGVERDLGGLRERADQQQQAAGDDVRRVVGEHVVGGIERRGVVDAAGVPEDEERAEHEADIAEHVDQERLEPGARRRCAPVPERDQQVRGGADERPADDQQHEVPGEHEQEHREHEVVEVREVPADPDVALHVRDRVQVDHRRDAGDDQRHEHRQRIDVDRELRVDSRGDDVVPQRRAELSVIGAAAQQRHEHRDGERKRERDRERADPAGDARRDDPPSERQHEHAQQRAEQHEPPKRCRR